MDIETNTGLESENFLAVSARYLGVHAVLPVDSANPRTTQMFRGVLFERGEPLARAGRPRGPRSSCRQMPVMG